MAKQLSNLKLEVVDKLTALLQTKGCTSRERLQATVLLAELNGLFELSDQLSTYKPCKSADEEELLELQAEHELLLAAKDLKVLSDNSYE